MGWYRYQQLFSLTFRTADSRLWHIHETFTHACGSKESDEYECIIFHSFISSSCSTSSSCRSGTLLDRSVSAVSLTPTTATPTVRRALQHQQLMSSCVCVCVHVSDLWHSLLLLQLYFCSMTSPTKHPLTTSRSVVFFVSLSVRSLEQHHSVRFHTWCMVRLSSPLEPIREEKFN